MARKQPGALSPKTYFPRNGDQLEDWDAGICWECRKAHTYLDDLTGETIKYALLIGRVEDLGDTPIPKIPVSTLSNEYLNEIDVIRRTKGGVTKVYKWNETRETWQEAI